MMKKLFAMLMVLVLCLGMVPSMVMTASAADGTTWDGSTVATAYAGGDGTEANPYIIETAGQLIYFRNQVNGGQAYNEKYFRLDADLDMAGKTFGAAIGTNPNYSTSRYFNGHFDGNNHKISNLTIGNNNNGYSALFGNVGFNGQEVVIKDLTLVNVKVNRTATNYGAAALVGQPRYARIENCIVESGTITSAAYYAGGLVASLNTSGTSGLTIINCVNKADVTNTSTGPAPYTGGILGSGSGAKITGCINYGKITTNKYYVGGIAGKANKSTIEKCANYGSVTSNNGNASGILADGPNAVIKNCYNQGNVTAASYATGIKGLFGSSSGATDIIENCYSIGTLTGTQKSHAISIRGSYYNGCTLNNNYSLTVGDEYVTQKNAGEFADGTVYELLQGANTEQVWGQTIGTDRYPVFYNGSNILQQTVAVTGVTLDKEAISLNVGGTDTLTATVAPTDATNKAVTWSSDAESVATVTDGVVTAVAPGSATITVTTQNGSKTATCVVTVLGSHVHAWNSYTGTCGEGECDQTHFTHDAYEWSDGKCSVCGVRGGYCGFAESTSVEYVLTSEDSGSTYTLTISGTGTMGEYIDYGGMEINTPWYDYSSQIYTIVINEGVEDIGWGAFKHLVNLNSVSIPNSVTEIKRAAFIGASSLTSITLPSSITEIGQAVFKESGLTSILIPSGVTKIQGSTFSGCTKLATVTLPNSITEIEGNAFQQCSSLSQITLPTGLTTVGEWAFNQSGLTSVTIPSSVTSLGMHAFSGCPNLQTVMINGTNLAIAERAFQGDEALEILTINNTGNVSIGDYAFMIEAAEDDDEVDIGDVGIGGWTPADDDQIETQSSINSRSTVKYTSQSETGEIGKDKLYTITLPDNVTYTTDYATSFKNRVRAVDIGDTATVLVGNSIKASPAFTSDTAFDETLTWSTSNSEVATVDANGKVTGVSAGSATITAISKYQLNGAFRTDSCVVTVKQHTHEWSYSVNVAKDTITATCSNTDNNCPNADGGSVNIALPDSVEYTGSAIEAKVTDNMIPEHTVVYSGDGLVAGKPVNPGSYRASITVDTDKTASVEYTIDQATLTVYGTGIASGTYGAKLSELTISGLTATLNGNEVYGTWTLTSEDVPNVGDTGSYTVTFTPAAHAEYYKPLTAQVTLNIDPAQHAAPTAVEGSYEPNANRTAFVYTVSKPSGIAYEYSTNGADWQDSPIFDGFNAGDKATFYARVKEDSNHTASDSMQSDEVTFEKLDQAAPALSYQVSGNSGNRTITIAEVEGAEYSFDGGNTWDSSNVKNGINDETVSIAIRMKETAVYKASEKVSASVNTARQVQTVTFDTTDRTATYGDGTLEGRAASAEGAITYESSDTAVATVDDKGVVTIVGAGTATITAKAAETETHAAAQASYSLTVNPKALTAEGITLTLTESLYQYDGNAKTPVVLLKDGNTVLEAGKDYQVKDGSTTTASAIAVYTITLSGKGNYTGDVSEEWEITRIAAPAAPQNLQGVAPTTGLVDDGKIIGTTDEMEYATKADFSDAKDCGEAETTNLAPGTYYVRLKGTDTTEPGAAAVVNVPAYSAPVITFDANGGTVAIASVTTEQDGTLAELPTATRSGYTFDGWFTAKTGGTQVTADTFFSVSTTIHAQWTYIPVPPVIDSPAGDSIVEAYEGQTARMTVVSQNATSYQWFINRNDGAGFVEYDGSTLATHTTAVVKPENDGFRYYCLVTNADGSVRSHVFTLKVLEQIDLPQTGDNSHIGVWMAMCLLSMAGILLLRKKPCSR